MRRTICTLILVVCLFACGGCRILESLTDDVGGWDLSACVGGFSVCWELFTDNAGMFEDSFVDAMEGLQ